MSAECQSSVGRHVVLVNRPSVDTIGRYVGRHSADTSADMLRSTVASVSVECRWGIGRLLTVAAISLPTGEAKEESIAYSRVLIERGCSSNCRHFEYICNATCWQALSRKRRDSPEHIPECPIDGKKHSIDRYIYICYLPAGRSVLGKTVPEVLSTTRGRRPMAVPKTEGTVFPNTDRTRPVNTLFVLIFARL